MLCAENGFSIIASCRDVTSCIEAIRGLSPHLALLDSLPGQSALQILSAIKAEHLATRVVFLSTGSHVAKAVMPTASHAYGIISREAAPDLLVHFLRKVASGPTLVPDLPEGAPGGSRAALEDPSTVLTERERQIAGLVCQGYSNKEVGRRFNLSEGTVKVHLHHIYQKLAIRNRTTLAALTVPSIKEPS